jgi:hypothetical protein
MPASPHAISFGAYAYPHKKYVLYAKHLSRSDLQLLPSVDSRSNRVEVKRLGRQFTVERLIGKFILHDMPSCVYAHLGL